MDVPEVKFSVRLDLRREKDDPEGLYRIDGTLVEAEIPHIFVHVRCSGILVVDYEKVPDSEEIHTVFRREVRFDQDLLRKITDQIEEKMKRNGELILDMVKSELNLPVGDEDVTAHISLSEVPEKNIIQFISTLYVQTLKTAPFPNYIETVRKLVDRFVSITKNLVENSVEAIVSSLNQKNSEGILLRRKLKDLGFSVRSIKIGSMETNHGFEILRSEVRARVNFTSGPKQPAVYEKMIESWTARQFLIFLTTFCFPFREIAYPIDEFMKIVETIAEVVKNEEVPVTVKVRLSSKYGWEPSKEIIDLTG